MADNYKKMKLVKMTCGEKLPVLMAYKAQGHGGRGILWRPPAQLIYVFSALILLVDNKMDISL